MTGLREILKQYEQTGYYDQLNAILHTQKALYLTRDAERYISSKNIGNALYELIGELVSYVAELRGTTISEDVQERINDNVFIEFDSIFRTNVIYMTFDEDITREIIKKIIIYLNFSFVYSWSDKIIDVTLTKPIPPIIDYYTVCIFVEQDTNNQTVLAIKQKLGTKTETIKNPSEILIKGFYHYTHGFRRIEQYLKED